MNKRARTCRESAELRPMDDLLNEGLAVKCGEEECKRVCLWRSSVKLFDGCCSMRKNEWDRRFNRVAKRKWKCYRKPSTNKPEGYELARGARANSKHYCYMQTQRQTNP
jgi:hypothetical protein